MDLNSAAPAVAGDVSSDAVGFPSLPPRDLWPPPLIFHIEGVNGEMVNNLLKHLESFGFIMSAH
ncbi:hypothetical protein CASFOL_027889 [Castilleja foliolosa]|uniref:Uncharacterized protein n=1 Tax=Castilleja foliolosa TaxID=1961234 RepID=A0ABD3CG36_9LAMI